MNELFKKTILESTGASSFFKIQKIQDLWSGYGEIVRYGLSDSQHKSIVVKHVRLPELGHHPRGWNTNQSHNRKIKSYEVEMAFYQKYSHRCDASCRIPHCLAMKSAGDEVLIILEDLNTAGFPERRGSVSILEMEQCILWLANFHAVFMNEQPQGLWSTGTYWHLETRPEELSALKDRKLKKAAPLLDKMLSASTFQTFVHGDAKLANFCFSSDSNSVAAVDFQYVGGGCGMKDLAYLIGSCFYEDDCEKMESRILDLYFKALKGALAKHNNKVDAQKVESDWRTLFPVAWTDFHRFIQGWSPGHWKINSYSEKMARRVIDSLEELK